MSNLTLAQLEARIATALMDTTYATFSTATIDDAIRRAVLDYSAAVPRRNNTTLALTTALSTNGREIDVSTISGALDVTDIWCPYAAADDTPTVRTFEYWKDVQTVYLLSGTAAQSTDTARIFYTAVHTLNGLDGATATTLPDVTEQHIQMGAMAYAILSRAVDLTEQVTVQPDTPRTLVQMAQEALTSFHNLLKHAGDINAAEKTRAR